MRQILISTAIGLGLACMAVPAHSAVLINVTESGGALTFTTSGSLNLAGAQFLGGIGENDGFISGGSNWYIASGTANAVDNYAMTSFDGPFGTNGSFINNPTTSTGDQFFIWGQSGLTEQVGVPVGYISGTIFNSFMSFVGLTIAGSGLLSGTYHYAIPNDTVTLKIGVSTVPLPAALPLFAAGLAGVGMLGRRARRKKAN